MTILPEQPARSARRLPARPWLVVAAIVLVAVVAAAVVVATRGGSHPARTSPASNVGGSRPHAWRVAIDAVSQPAPVGALFVVYAAAEGKLRLTALDATSGRVVWTRPASPSAIAPGTAPKLAVAGNRVIYLAEAGGQSAAVVAADANTGQPAWQSAPGLFSDWPTVCPDDPSAVCTSGQLPGSAAGVLRFDVATGRRLPSPPLGSGARALTTDLFDVGQRHPEIVVGTNGSAV